HRPRSGHDHAHGRQPVHAGIRAGRHHRHDGEQPHHLSRARRTSRVGLRQRHKQRHAAHHHDLPAMRNAMKLPLATLLALPLFAQPPYSISPSQGNVIGGEVVTIKGDLIPHDYEVYFDYTRALFTTRVDDTTLVAAAPPHVAGTAKIVLLVYGVY